MISGGAGQQYFIRQLLADATGLPVMATNSEEPILLGAAILGAVAGQRLVRAYRSLRSAFHGFSRAERLSC